MQFNISPSDKAKQLLLMHGVPRSLLNDFKVNIAKELGNLEIAQQQKNKIILASQQKRWFEQIYKQIDIDPAIIIISSTDFYLQARRTGLLLFWQYLSYSLNYPRDFKNSKPIWHLPDLSYKNNLLEAYHRGEHYKPNLLLIDSIYEDMPAIKVDKVHDLLQVFCDRPCILVIHGANPYNYCINRLGARPNKLLNFARQLRREIV
jgi:hypothetical protein